MGNSVSFWRNCQKATVKQSDRRTLMFWRLLDPRPYLDEAARISARFGGTGWLIAEAVTAALHHGGQLWYGTERNVGLRLREIAAELNIVVHVAR